MRCASCLRPTRDVCLVNRSTSLLRISSVLFWLRNNQGHGIRSQVCCVKLINVCDLTKGNSPFRVETRLYADCIDTDVECKRFLGDVKPHMSPRYTHLSVTILAHVIGALRPVCYFVYALIMA